MSIVAPSPTPAGPPAGDPLGDRMKGYEHTARLVLMPRQWAAIRIDGRAFHTWTRGLERPYSLRMVEAMGATLLGLCEQIPGAVCGYTQSDELTVILCDFMREDTQPWFGGQVQKIVSIAASMATVLFAPHFPDRKPAMFDARAFNLPGRVEVANNLLWRQADARRNAISMLAQDRFSASQLHGASTEQRVQMLALAGVPSADIDSRFLHGQFARRVTAREHVEYRDRRSGELRRTADPVIRRRWELTPAPNLDAQPDGLLLSRLLAADPS